jgi:RNA polymerase sigma-70 factor (ECF subfamily)
MSALSDKSTGFLLDLARSGSGEAQDTLFERYLRRLQKWARGRLPSQARSLIDTDDLVQETLLNVLRHVGSFEQRHAGAFQGYLRRSVVNKIHDHLRRLGRSPETSTDLVKIPTMDASPLELAIGTETLERYERALSKLRSEERFLVIARVELGFDYKEIAREFDKSTPQTGKGNETRSHLLARAAAPSDSQSACRPSILSLTTGNRRSNGKTT